MLKLATSVAMMSTEMDLLDRFAERLCFVLCAKALEEDERSWQRLIAEIDLLTKEQSHDHSSQA